jgi:hypothetical protein
LLGIQTSQKTKCKQNNKTWLHVLTGTRKVVRLQQTCQYGQPSPNILMDYYAFVSCLVEYGLIGV